MIEEQDEDQTERDDLTASNKSATSAGPSRRAFLQQTGASLLVLPQIQLNALTAPTMADSLHIPTSVQTVRIRLTINKQLYELQLDARTTLLDLCRDQLGLTGTKKGCNHGQCGACTVLINNERINACLALAVLHEDDAITTIEGLAAGDQLHPLQTAFMEHDGFQCGYCTPGQICSAVGMLAEVATGTASTVTRTIRQTKPITLSNDEIRERMSGNICRCGAYPNIVAAIHEVARTAPK